MFAYVDQNFLVYCIGNQKWRQAVIAAHRSGVTRIVLSPWHFYEYGNASKHPDAEELLKFAEELQPHWTMTRADLQTYELWVVWQQIWKSYAYTINPIGSLQQITAILHKVHPSRTAHITIRDYVDAFSGIGSLEEIKAAMKENANNAESNQLAFTQGRFDKATETLISLKHLATQTARMEIMDDTPPLIWQRAETLLTEQPIATCFKYFVEWGCMRYLKCYQAEKALSEELYSSGGRLAFCAVIKGRYRPAALDLQYRRRKNWTDPGAFSSSR